MAKQFITKGIGATPGGIKWFILKGLVPASAVVPPSGSLSLYQLNIVLVAAIEKNVLSSDFSNNALRLVTTITNINMTQRMGMWGEPMWGSEEGLGAAISSAYKTGILNVRNV